jgi:hypothetical protein
VQSGDHVSYEPFVEADAPAEVHRNRKQAFPIQRVELAEDLHEVRADRVVRRETLSGRVPQHRAHVA